MVNRVLSSFLILTLVVVLAVIAVGDRPATAQQSTTLKMQASWPASLTLYDNFKMFAEKVKKIPASHPSDAAVPASTSGGYDQSSVPFVAMIAIFFGLVCFSASFFARMSATVRCTSCSSSLVLVADAVSMAMLPSPTARGG